MSRSFSQTFPSRSCLKHKPGEYYENAAVLDVLPPVRAKIYPRPFFSSALSRQIFVRRPFVLTAMRYAQRISRLKPYWVGSLSCRGRAKYDENASSTCAFGAVKASACLKETCRCGDIFWRPPAGAKMSAGPQRLKIRRLGCTLFERAPACLKRRKTVVVLLALSRLQGAKIPADP